MELAQVVTLMFSGVSAVGVIGLFYRLGVYSQKVDGHDVKFLEHEKIHIRLEGKIDKHGERIGSLEQRVVARR